MATQGQPLSAVAAQAGQYVKFKCGKGECGTCEVRVDGQWIRTCVAKMPYVPKGEEYNVFVRPTMVKSKKSSRFFSFRYALSVHCTSGRPTLSVPFGLYSLPFTKACHPTNQPMPLRSPHPPHPHPPPLRSFLAGAKNNILGMVGFVKEGRQSKDAFEERMQREKDILAKAEAKRASKQNGENSK